MTLPFVISSLEESGTLTGIASFDSGGPNRNKVRYRAGAFDKSLAAHKAAGTMPAMLIFHDANRPVGTWDSIVPKGNALEVRGRVLRDTSEGAEAYAMVKAKAIRSLSTGAIHIKEENAAGPRAPGDITGIDVLEADLVEISLVAVAADPKANIIRVNDLTGPAEIEDLFRSAGMSGRKAKTAASAAWRSLQSNTDPAADGLAAILNSASGRLARFQR